MLHGQHGEELTDLCFAHFCRVTFLMKEDEALNPVDVGLFCSKTVVPEANRRADLVEQLGLLFCGLKGRTRKGRTGE